MNIYLLEQAVCARQCRGEPRKATASKHTLFIQESPVASEMEEESYEREGMGKKKGEKNGQREHRNVGKAALGLLSNRRAPTLLFPPT